MIPSERSIILETKLVGVIDGIFHIPSFQRGYRWGSDEVIRLLEDIYTNGTKSYSLQPVVVARKNDEYELIDGQQRLTTIYLIYKYMNETSNGFLSSPKFSLIYDTKEESTKYLETLDVTLKDKRIDSWFMFEAYETIANWFEGKGSLKQSALTNMNKYFDENVKVIWYEVDESIDAIALFARLNIGKIQLTSAELVKATFLCNSNHNRLTDKEKQEKEISQQWDVIERELQNDSFWYFLTNVPSSKYQTRIGLLLDLISGKPINSKEKYYTFFYFDSQRKEKSISDIWREIQHTFLMLKDWFEDHELYHKIGYLITSGEKRLQDIYALTQVNQNSLQSGITKRSFKSKLDKFIKDSIQIDENYSDLRYDNSKDYSRISKLLLLFNVESIRINSEQTQWFPFEKFKTEKTGRAVWSLEHIHAQKSDGLKKQQDWKEWLRLHSHSINTLPEDNADLLEKMENACEMQSLDRQTFEQIQELVLQKLSTKGNIEYLHSISNLALLKTDVNAALSNSTFDVKRNAIIEMDKQGQYIPFCTKMVFLKYYTPSSDNQLHFWGQQDRIAYVKEINSVLSRYLGEKKILIEMEHE